MKDSQANTSPTQGHPTKSSPALRLLRALADFEVLDEESPATVLLSVRIIDTPPPGITGVAQLTDSLADKLAALLAAATDLHAPAGAL
ncbi:hypothetical protein [Kitasatospora cineracea]|uniref:Uncharacterized protein n=1 Tax=Kitasatospora cineracea TaxID=88074 RepID=A0A3N4R1W4_9ACTN|nr:hypothetical protein [Kitasatospora cineracea]RPE27318.1 hypothetical protein EDD38_7463 [Kitasatospora cineracea]